MKDLAIYKEKGIRWEGIIEKVKELAKNNIIFLLGTCLLVYKGLLINYLLNLSIGIDVVCYTVAAPLLLMVPVINHKDKFAYIYLNSIYAIVTLVLYADFLYYSYSTNFLSFYQIENVKYAKEIGNGLLYVINIKSVLLFWIDNLSVAIISILAYKKWKNSYSANKIAKSIVILIIVLLNVGIVKDNINYIYQDKGYNKSLIVQDASIYYYHYEDGKDYLSSLFIKEPIDEERLANAYEENQKEKETTTIYTGAVQDSNVIILQLESLNEFVIGKTVNGKEITPNLNRFFSENIYCTDMYNQGLGTTADSEFEMENSMYPLENGYVFQKYYDNTWSDIYTTLRNERILYLFYAS